MKRIIVKCSECNKKREIKGGEIDKFDFPMCDCGMPMLPIKAINRR